MDGETGEYLRLPPHGCHTHPSNYQIELSYPRQDGDFFGPRMVDEFVFQVHFIGSTFGFTHARFTHVVAMGRWPPTVSTQFERKVQQIITTVHPLFLFGYSGWERRSADIDWLGDTWMGRRSNPYHRNGREGSIFLCYSSLLNTMYIIVPL